VHIDPQSGEAWLWKADMLRTLQRFEEAVSDYDKALSCDDEVAETWRGKAAALRALGREASAKLADARAAELEAEYEDDEDAAD
jgi:tetratricopeptide (TPR) repeat protein